MKSTPTYIKSLKLLNIRTFGDVELNFEDEEGHLSQWTLILGDNGIGKSTIMQSVAWMKPQLPDNSDVGMTLTKDEIEPMINNEENESLVKIVRKGNLTGKIDALYVAERKLGSKISSRTTEKYCNPSIRVDLTSDGKLEDVVLNFETNAEEIFLHDEIIIYTYSASRRLGNQNITDVNLEDAIPDFISEQTILYDAEEILHTLNYAALGAEKKEKVRYDSFLNKVIKMLVSILPDFENVESIEISSPKFVDKLLKPGEVVLSTKHGKKIPFSNFSLGYKSVISWTVDLAWRLFNQYPHSRNPLSEAAIVLIDEIDLHLHPKWQREIMANLSENFPNVQFIATAHSPLMVQAAKKQNYAILRFDETEGVEIINDPKAIDGWRVDQILTSEFFNLKSSRGLDYEELFNKREVLLQKSRLNAGQKEELELITNKLSEYPVGENPEEISNRQLISELAKKIRENNVEIKI